MNSLRDHLKTEIERKKKNSNKKVELSIKDELKLIVWKSILINALPMFISVLIVKIFDRWWVISITLFIFGILFFVFREKIASIYFEERKNAIKMSKNVSWTILKKFSYDFPEDERGKDICIKEAINMGVSYMFMAIVVFFSISFLLYIMK